MAPQHPLSQWIDQVTTHFPRLSRPQATVLALGSFGMVLAHCCGLSSVALALSPLLGHRGQTVRQRLREFYRDAQAKRGRGRTQIDPTVCFASLLQWILADGPSRRVALALDATTLADRWTVLAVSVRVPRLRRAGGLDGPAGQPTRGLEPPLAAPDGPARAAPRCRVDGRGPVRPRSGVPDAVRGDRRPSPSLPSFQ
jgi:hypothetical protein